MEKGNLEKYSESAAYGKGEEASLANPKFIVLSARTIGYPCASIVWLYSTKALADLQAGLAMEIRRKQLAPFGSADTAAALPRPGEHEITALQAFASSREFSAVRVRTRGGLTGYGECAVVTPAEVEQARKALIGRPATAYVGAALSSSIDCAVNTALLDIIGQASKSPVYRVLGGPTRHKVRVMTALEGSSDTELMNDLHAARDAGFRAFSVPLPLAVGNTLSRSDLRQVLSRLEFLRSSVGDSVDFVLDGAALLAADEAQRLAVEMEPFHLLWFDEPCAFTSSHRLKRFAEETVTPLGFGRNVPSANAFLDLLREGVVDIVRPDLAREGIPGSRRIAALAETYYVAVAPCHEGGPIGAAAALQLAATLPNFFIQHVPRSALGPDRGMRSELLASKIGKVIDGFVELPTGPGLSIQVNDSILEKYREI